MRRETGSLYLLAPLLLTGGKRADLVIRGNVVLNKFHPRGFVRAEPLRNAINKDSGRHCNSYLSRPFG
jgi:hypothetical protein